MAPSNGLAALLDRTNGQPDMHLGNDAAIDTDTGVVTVDGARVAVQSETLAQSGAPSIRVFLVRSLTAHHVRVTGNRALAVVSAGDLKITGVFEASATLSTAGAGSFNDDSCIGKDRNVAEFVVGGAGGGGFGSRGGSGGSASSDGDMVAAAAGGSATGNEALVPLRGGCNGGSSSGRFGAGGGAIQLVSRTQIVVGGTVAANGSGHFGGGGSGGGILLEAPIVEVSGGVVANGGGGGGGYAPDPAQNGQRDATPANGGPGDTALPPRLGRGGNGGAGATDAGHGESVDHSEFPAAGDGGGGVGRIRINTAPGGLRGTGVLSPRPSTGRLGTR